MTDEKKRGRLRWKRRPPSTGLRSMVEPTVHSYTDGVETFATVQAVSRPGRGWFWYGMGRNTCNEPTQTLDHAKEEAERHVKTALTARTRGE